MPQHCTLFGKYLHFLIFTAMPESIENRETLHLAGKPDIRKVCKSGMEKTLLRRGKAKVPQQSK